MHAATSARREPERHAAGRPKILPIGQGTREREMIRLLAASGYAGPIGILCHLEDADAEAVLRRTLDGLQALVGEERR